MGKRQAASPAPWTDENSDGWLSTRNKKKISPVPKPSRRHHLLYKSVSRSPLVTLLEDIPLAQGASKKQTSIADFFSPRLKELPLTDNKNLTVLQQHKDDQHKKTAPYDSDVEVYTDFDMPAPTPTQSSKNQLYSNFDVSAPTHVFRNTSSDHRKSAVLSPAAVRRTAPLCSWRNASDVLPCSQIISSEDDDKGVDNYNRTHSGSRISSPYASRLNKQDSDGVGVVQRKKTRHSALSVDENRLKHVDQSRNYLNSTTAASVPASIRDRKRTFSETGLTQGLEKEKCVRIYSPSTEHNMFPCEDDDDDDDDGDDGDDDDGDDDDDLTDSLQTPYFLKEAHNTLNLTELPALTDMDSLQFTLTDSDSQDTQHACRPVQTSAVLDYKKGMETGRKGWLTSSSKKKLQGMAEQTESKPRNSELQQQGTAEQKESKPCHSGEVQGKVTVEQKKTECFSLGEMEEQKTAGQNQAKPRSLEEMEGKITAEWKETKSSKPGEAEGQITVTEKDSKSCSMAGQDHQGIMASRLEEECDDSLQTPEFFSTELDSEGSQETFSWTQQREEPSNVTGFVLDDLQTPGFLLGCQEDSSSGDMC